MIKAVGRFLYKVWATVWVTAVLLGAVLLFLAFAHAVP